MPRCFLAFAKTPRGPRVRCGVCGVNIAGARAGAAPQGAPRYIPTTPSCRDECCAGVTLVKLSIFSPRLRHPQVSNSIGDRVNISQSRASRGWGIGGCRRIARVVGRMARGSTSSRRGWRRPRPRLRRLRGRTRRIRGARHSAGGANSQPRPQ